MQNPTLLAALTEWRSKYRKMFLTQFVPTVDRTRRWLERLTATPTRLLFAIESLQGELLGQFGLKDAGPREIELDNGILGTAGAPPRLFYHTERSLLQWCFGSAGVDRAIAQVFSHNVFAIKLHKQVGFTATRTSPLVLEVTQQGEHHYRLAAASEATDVPFQLVRMEIARSEFE